MKRQYKTVEFYLINPYQLPKGLKHKLLKAGFRVKDYYHIAGTNKNCLVVQYKDVNQTYDNLKKILGDSMGYWFLYNKPEHYWI